MVKANISSIVAIHGIGAHPDDTWSKNVGTKEDPRYVNWLSDLQMLPAAVPDVRILRYGYESAWFGQDAMRQRVSGVARRLLLSLRRVRKVKCSDVYLLLRRLTALLARNSHFDL